MLAFHKQYAYIHMVRSEILKYQRLLRGLVNIKKYKNPKKVWIRYTPPTHSSIQKKKFRKISKVIYHVYLYIEARTKA